jgi:ubiquinone/menaquinone biosynthesis C-methylase UbiE
MDVRDLKYDDNSFDFAIDKSTIDALLCGDSSYINVAIMLKEVQRVLKDGGIYMIISYGKPENRVMHLKRKHLDFEVSIFTIKKESQVTDDIDDSSKTHYVYICKKNKNANDAEKYFEDVYTELLQQELMDKELEYAEMNEEEEEEKDDIGDENYNEEQDFEKEAISTMKKQQKLVNTNKSSKIVLPKINN